MLTKKKGGKRPQPRLEPEEFSGLRRNVAIVVAVLLCDVDMKLSGVWKRTERADQQHGLGQTQCQEKPRCVSTSSVRLGSFHIMHSLQEDFTISL